jgi:pimeloyl-ACP methyl ester carboxylesterase
MATLRSVEANGITQRFAEAGEGPLVVLLHGFPESWYSYRHQLDALARAGYHAVAPDMRGYGGTDAPEEIDRYSLLHLAGDVVGLAAALGENRFVVVGHDWGSPVASSVGLFRPDVVRGVVLLSVPYIPRGDTDVLTALTQSLGPDNYQVFFQEPGVAEKLHEADVRKSVLAWLIGISGDVSEVHGLSKVDADTLLPDFSGEPLPAWLEPEDVDYYTSELERTGFRGPLNWYRTSRLNWELLGPWRFAPLLPPSLFVAGERDPVVNWPGIREFIDGLLPMAMPNLTKAALLQGCGHWTQQERPEEVNRFLLEFLEKLPD